MAFGKEIKRLRGKLSAAKVAGLIGVNTDKLRKWEERNTDPSDTGDIKMVEDYFNTILTKIADIKSFDFVQKKSETPFDKIEASAQRLIKSSENIIAIQDKLITTQATMIKKLEDEATTKKDNQLTEIKESLNKLSSAVAELSELHKEIDLASLSALGKKSVENLDKKKGSDSGKGS